MSSMAVQGVAPTVVLAASPIEGAWSPISIPLAVMGIDPATVTVSGALRGSVYREGDYVFYQPDLSAFPKTDFDLLQVRGPEAQTVLNVAVVRAESSFPEELVAHAGYAAVADPGWETAGDAVWDSASDAYVVTGKGELNFDFLRDDVTDRTFSNSRSGAQSGSGSSVTLRPPPPTAPFAAQGPMLVYQGGAGGDVWELWLHPSESGYEVEAVLSSGVGDTVRSTVPAPPGSELGLELGSSGGEVLLGLTGSGGETYYYLPAPPGFTVDRTWHRFGNLEGKGDGTFGLAELRVMRSSIDLARQVVLVDDFDAPEWAKVWTSYGAGTLRLEPTRVLRSGFGGGGELVASLDPAAQQGPAFLARSLDVPRVAMTCRFVLDLSFLSDVGDGDGSGVPLVALRDESQPDPLERDYARFLVRQNGPDRQVRLVGVSPHQTAATPWITLAASAATFEVQWQKTAADESRLDLWIDGCGPAGLPCASGWEVTGIAQPGLVTAVRLGILGSPAGTGGEVRFDDVACAGDSWVEPE